MKIVCVCAHCAHNDDDPNFEINFKDQVIYYYCSKCKKENKISLKIELKPLPKVRTR